METTIKNISSGTYTARDLNNLANAVEPLCDGNTGTLLEWITEGARSGTIHMTDTVESIAAEWNEYTTEAQGD